MECYYLCLVTDHCHIKEVVDLQLLVDTPPVSIHFILLFLGKVIFLLFHRTLLLHIKPCQMLPGLNG